MAPWFLLLITLVVLVVRYQHTQFFSPDSWSYYELSKSVGDDFFRIRTVRTFEFLEPYGSSFPPLWPIAIALGRSIVPAGPETGIFLNLAIVAATAACLEWLFRNIVGFRGAGPLIVLFMLSFRPFREEVLSARAMPLALLELSLLTAALRYVSEHPRRTAIVSGLLLGTLVMTRFDWLVPAMLLPVVGSFSLRKGRMRWLLAAYGTFFISLLPWIAYSFSHFGEVFVSDNSVVVLSAESRFVLDFVPAESPTLFTSPGQWIGRLANNVSVLWEMSKRAVAGGLLPGAIVLVSLLLGRVVAGLPRYRTRMGPETAAGRADQKRTCLLLLFALGPVIVLQALLPPLVLGYGDARYASGVTLLLACIVVVGIVLSCRSPSCAVRVGIGALLAGAILVLLGLPTRPVFRFPPLSIQPVATCVADRDLVMIVGNDTLAAKLGAVHDQRTAMTPSNLDQLDSGAIESLVKRFSIRFVFVPPTTVNENPAAKEALFDASTITLQASPCLDGLYEVKLASSVQEI